MTSHVLLRRGARRAATSLADLGLVAGASGCASAHADTGASVDEVMARYQDELDETYVAF